jgi:hypothetical protein
MLRVYPSSKSKHHPWWQALRAAGVPIDASWIDAEFNATGEEPSPTLWRSHWEACVSEAAEADIVLAVCRDDENQNGALIEIGAALGAGKWVYLVSPHSWSWKHHPRVRAFRSLEAAVTAIVAASS